MIWLGFIILFFLISFREILFGAYLILKRARPLDLQSSSVCLQAQGFRVPKAFLCDKISGRALSWNCIFGDLLFIEESWWNSRSLEEKEVILTWFSLANSQFLFFQRIFGLFSPKRCDRDCLLMGCPSTALVSVLESLSAELLQQVHPFLDSLLLGLSMHAGLMSYRSQELEARIQSTLSQQRRLQ